MAELGRKGGKASVRSRLGLDVDADVTLREKARKRLERQLDSPDERLAQAAARALYSYGPAKPPADADANSWEDLPYRKPIALAQLIETCVFECEGYVDDELAGMILKAAAKVRELQAAGKLSPNFVDVVMEDGVKRFTEKIESLVARSPDTTRRSGGAEAVEEGVVEAATEEVAGVKSIGNERRGSDEARSRSGRPQSDRA